MAWLEFHAERLQQLQKFDELRDDLSWSVNETLGFLGNWWGKVQTLREDGDIGSWKPMYLAKLTSAKASPARLWEALVRRDWIDLRMDGRGELSHALVHGWIEYGGTYLKSRYRRNDPLRLVRIWAMFGETYKLEPAQEKEWGAAAAALLKEIQPGYSQAKAGPPYRTVPDQPKDNDRGTPSAVDLARDLAARQERQALTLGWEHARLPFQFGEQPDPYPKGTPLVDLPVATLQAFLDVPRLGEKLTAQAKACIAQKAADQTPAQRRATEARR